MRLLFVFVFLLSLVSCEEEKKSSSESSSSASLEQPDCKDIDGVEESAKWKNIKHKYKDYTGIIKKCFKNGKVEKFFNVKNGKQNGEAKGWYENGQIRAVVNFNNGVPDGLLREWHENGDLKTEEEWENGKQKSITHYKETESETKRNREPKTKSKNQNHSPKPKPKRSSKKQKPESKSPSSMGADLKKEARENAYVENKAKEVSPKPFASADNFNNKPNNLYKINDPDGYTNIRSDKSVKSPVLFVLYENQYFEVIDNNGSWWKIKYDGKFGYVHKSRVKKAN